MTDERWWTVADVAAARGVAEGTIRGYVSDAVERPLPGRIPIPDDGLDDPPNRRRLRWRESTIRPWLDAGRRVGGRPARSVSDSRL